MNQIELKKAYSSLTSLRKNLDKESGDIEEKFIKLLHENLGKIDDTNLTLKEFYIPQEEIRPKAAGGRLGWGDEEGEQYYSNERFVNRTLFFTKLDAVLLLFKLEIEGTKIGFELT